MSWISSRRTPIPGWIAHRRRTTTRWKVSKPSNREWGSGLRGPSHENECELICPRVIGDPLAMSRENPRLEEGGVGWVGGCMETACGRYTDPGNACGHCLWQKSFLRVGKKPSGSWQKKSILRVGKKSSGCWHCLLGGGKESRARNRYQCDEPS